MHSYINIMKMAIEILILWGAIYFILIFAKGTRGVHVLKGIVFILIFFLFTNNVGLETINWIFSKLFAISVIAFLVIFQPELRRGLASIGQHSSASGLFLKQEEVIKEILRAVVSFSNRKIGAIIAIERESILGHYVESGIKIDAKMSTELLMTIFMPNTPLHDGGVIISGDRIVGAACLFPLTQNPSVSMTMGTRHRAGLGLSEETDAAVIIVSEETGGISLAADGKITQRLDKDTLEQLLNDLCRRDTKKRGFLFNMDSKK